MRETNEMKGATPSTTTQNVQAEIGSGSDLVIGPSQRWCAKPGALFGQGLLEVTGGFLGIFADFGGGVGQLFLDLGNDVLDGLLLFRRQLGLGAEFLQLSEGPGVILGFDSRNGLVGGAFAGRFGGGKAFFNRRGVDTVSRAATGDEEGEGDKHDRYSSSHTVNNVGIGGTHDEVRIPGMEGGVNAVREDSREASPVVAGAQKGSLA